MNEDLSSSSIATGTVGRSFGAAMGVVAIADFGRKDWGYGSLALEPSVIFTRCGTRTFLPESSSSGNADPRPVETVGSSPLAAPPSVFPGREAPIARGPKAGMIVRFDPDLVERRERCRSGLVARSPTAE